MVSWVREGVESSGGRVSATSVTASRTASRRNEAPFWSGRRTRPKAGLVASAAEAPQAEAERQAVLTTALVGGGAR